MTAPFEIDYTGKDYDSIVTALDNALTQLFPEWTNRDINDPNWAVVLIQAYVSTLLMFYIDFGVNELNPRTVQLYENAIKLALFVGYRPKILSGAVTEISVTVTTTPHTIVKGEVFETDTGIKYAALEDVVFPGGEPTKDVKVVYGAFERVVLGISDGSDYQEFILDRERILGNSIEIFIDEGGGFVRWDEIETFILSDENDKEYRRLLLPTEKTMFQFGDDLNGKKPVNTADIEVEVFIAPTNYVDEKYGNIGAGAITKSSDSNVASITHTDISTGGGEKEAHAKVQRSIPQWVATGGQIISIKQAEHVARNFPGVESARAKAAIDNTMLVYIQPVGGGLPSVALKDLLQDYMQRRAAFNTTIQVESPIPVDIDLDYDLVVRDNYKRDTVKQDVLAAAQAILTGDIEQEEGLAISKVYEALEAPLGIKSITITKLAESPGSGVNNIDFEASEFRNEGTITPSVTGGIV